MIEAIASATMERLNWFRAELWRLDAPLWLLIIATFTAVFVSITTPWLSLASVAALVAAVSYAARHDRLPLAFMPPPLWLIGAGIGISYIVLSIMWSSDPRTTALTALIIAALVLCVHTLSRWFDDCPTAWLEHMTRTVLVAVIAALLFLLSEELTGHAIKRALFWPFRALRWQDGGLSLSQLEGVVLIPPQRVKWNMPPLDFLLWPTLLMASLQLGRGAALWPQVAIASATFWVILLSDHKTSLAAITAAIIVFLAAHWRPAWVRQALVVVWSLSFFVIIPVAMVGYHSSLHLDPRIGPTFQARIILWNHTAKEFAKQPLLGVGAAATRLLDRRNLPAAEAAQPKDFVYAQRTGPHAHNIFLQSFYELGMIGTGIFLWFGVLILNGIARTPETTQPYILATVTTVIVTTSSSFGLFETWFMAVFAMCAVGSMMAIAYRRRVLD